MTVTLVFDTETNGMRPRGRSNPLSAEPALVQLAAVQYLEDRPVGHMSMFIRPIDGAGRPAIIPKEKFFIESGITQDVVDSVGVSLVFAMRTFLGLCEKSDRVVAHNIAFDDPVIRAAFERSGVDVSVYDGKPKCCTMKTLEPILKIPGKYGFKYPSLAESYVAMVDKGGFEGAHDAMVDVEACASVLWKTEEAGHDLWQLK